MQKISSAKEGDPSSVRGADAAPEDLDSGTLARRTVEDIYASVRNLDHGVVGDEFDLDEVRELLND